jgi:hypothetical protein
VEANSKTFTYVNTDIALIWEAQRGACLVVKKVLTRFAVAKKTAENGEAVYRSPRIYLPTKLTDDSVFPFKEGDLLMVKVDGRKLVVQRVRKPGLNSVEANESRQK